MQSGNDVKSKHANCYVWYITAFLLTSFPVEDIFDICDLSEVYLEKKIDRKLNEFKC